MSNTVERCREMAVSMGIDLSNLKDDLDEKRLLPKTVRDMQTAMGWSAEATQTTTNKLRDEGLLTTEIRDDGEEYITLTEKGIEVILVMERIAFTLMPVEGAMQ